MFGRRDILLWALVAGCSRKEDARAAEPLEPQLAKPGKTAVRGEVKLLEWEFEGAFPRAAVLVPAWGAADTKYPVVVALHGRGEARTSPKEGALGWPRDYALVRAIKRVASPPLTSADAEGFITKDHLAEMNRELAEKPFGGLIVVCPYLPDIDLTAATDALAYGQFVVETLLPRVHRETPSLADSASTGIDGISLGGAAALRIGFAHPNVFGAVGALQPAIQQNEAAEYTDLVRAARAKNAAQKLRILTSEKDYFRQPIQKLSQSLFTAGQKHEYVDVPGPHDYIFNRGPGSLELLRFHARALAQR